MEVDDPEGSGKSRLVYMTVCLVDVDGLHESLVTQPYVHVFCSAP